MFRFHTIQWTAASLALVGMLIPISINHAANPLETAQVRRPVEQRESGKSDASSQQVSDVIVHHGRVQGVLFTRSGLPQPHQSLQIVDKGGVRQVTTDAQGRFWFPARPGAYQISAGSQLHAIRVWQPSAAPPTAKLRVLLAEESVVVRGQRPLGEVLLADPVMVGLVLAAAVAVPVVISARKKPS